MIQHIPLTESPGKLFTSPMPFRYDQGELLDRAQHEGVACVVMLISDEEAQEKCGHDLRHEYKLRGLRLIHHPILDFNAPPDIEAFRRALCAAVSELQAGHSLLVHCAAGIGRTGLFVACLIGLLRPIPAEDAIAFVRTTIRGAVETEQQSLFVRTILTPQSAPAS